jgi:hypothetical protein
MIVSKRRMRQAGDAFRKQEYLNASVVYTQVCSLTTCFLEPHP